MTIPTEPIGSIPRPIALIEAIKTHGSNDPALDPMFDEAIRDTITHFEATGSPVITDGEQRKYHNFGTYCVDGLPNIAPDGFKLPFIHHTRQWPRLTRGPFRYLMSADRFIDVALEILEGARFDVLISDIGLPDGDGHELIRAAKERQALKGIALSGFGMEDDRRNSRESGFDYHLTKPIEFQKLESVLREIAS